MHYFTMLILLFSVLISNNLAAESLAKRGQYTLTQTNYEQMIFAGEKIAQHTFSQREKKKLKQWLIDIFNKIENPKGVQKALVSYQRYIQLANKQKHADDQQLIWHHFYRSMVFNWTFPTYRPKQSSLMDVIQRYNPIIRKLPKERLILAKKDKVIVKKGDYFLSYPMWLAMHRTANFLSKRKISNKATSRLYKWSLTDFKETPKGTSEFYHYLLDTVMPVFYFQQKGNDRNQFRLNTYAKFYFLLQKDSLAKRSNDDLMDIVTRYQPLLSANKKQKIIVTKEGSSKAIKQMTPQEFLLRQQMSAQILQMYGSLIRQNGETWSSFRKSINDSRTKTIIGLSSDDEVIETYNDSFLVERPNGSTYHISR